MLEALCNLAPNTIINFMHLLEENKQTIGLSLYSSHAELCRQSSSIPDTAGVTMSNTYLSSGRRRTSPPNSTPSRS